MSLAQFASHRSPACRQQFAGELLDALADFGFVVIADHGIQAHTFSRAYQLAEQLFALPEAQKTRYEMGNGQRGYIAFGRESAKGFSQPDLKEYWHVGPELSPTDYYYDKYPKNCWPDTELPEFRKFFLGLHRELNHCALRLLSALEFAMALPSGYFADLIAQGNSVQRLIHYPALSGDEPDDALRAAPHADINLMTLLVGATDAGLQILDRDGQWLAVENQLNDLVVDTGDMMALITNNRLPATVHRVVNPQERGRARYSIPFFVHPHNEAILRCLPQCAAGGAEVEPISAGDFLQQRLRENGF